MLKHSLVFFWYGRTINCHFITVNDCAINLVVILVYMWSGLSGTKTYVKQSGEQN